MKEFQIDVMDYHKFNNGQVCLIGDAIPKDHKVITSDCIARIYVEGVGALPLNILGQDLISRSIKTIANEQTILRTADNLDQILPCIGKRKITIIGKFPLDSK